MKISSAEQLYAPQLHVLWKKKQELTQLLKDPSASNLDRSAISRELSLVSESYEQARAGMEQIRMRESLERSAKASRQQSEAMAEASEEFLKCMEIARRIANGDLVPASDERRLIEYDYKMYMAAKNMASINQKPDPKVYDSLWKEEEEKSREVSPEEMSDSAEGSRLCAKTETAL